MPLRWHELIAPQSITNSARGNHHVKAGTFISAHKDFGGLCSLAFTVVKWKSTHTLFRTSLLLSPAYILHFNRLSLSNQLYFSENLSQNRNTGCKWLDQVTENKPWEKQVPTNKCLQPPPQGVSTWERELGTMNVEKLLDNEWPGNCYFFSCSGAGAQRRMLI